jgi:Ca2+-binding EF-hand superfamily protein
MENIKRKVIELFKIIDVNGNRFIEFDELKVFLEGHNFSNEEIEDLKVIIDKNYDGKIDLQEFAAKFDVN